MVSALLPTGAVPADPREKQLETPGNISWRPQRHRCGSRPSLRRLARTKAPMGVGKNAQFENDRQTETTSSQIKK